MFDSKVGSRAHRKDIIKGEYIAPALSIQRMNRMRKGELWKHSYIAYLLEFKGFNYVLSAKVVGLSYNQFKQRLLEPKTFRLIEVEKLSRLLNFSFFEMVALIDLVGDVDAAKYTAEFYYSEMLKSKNLSDYRAFKKAGVLYHVNPIDLQREVNAMADRLINDTEED